MIVVKITGGLGNQLFQYSFGKFLSEKFNTDLKLFINTEYNYSGFTKRLPGLERMGIAYHTASKNEIKKFKFFVDGGFFDRIERKLVQIVPYLNKKYIVQRGSFTNLRSKDDCFYDGYWQSEKYFKPIENKLREEFNFTPLLNEINKAIYLNIINSNSISIHIRRSDYISNKANSRLFEICSLDYYNNAITYLSGKYEAPVFFIFSDDADWARQNFKGEHFNIIEGNQENPEIDLYLMSNCQCNIIANSSFSWWGAWLNQNKEKIVIAPKKWYKNKKNKAIRDLIPDEWILI